MSFALERLKNLTHKIASYEIARKTNLERLEELFIELEIFEKVGKFEDLFHFKAINLSGASLLEEDFGAIKKGKYLQILAISYNKEAYKKSNNISLAYFGRVEKVDEKIKNKVIEFIIRYRFEKSFMTLEHYHSLFKEFRS